MKHSHFIPGELIGIEYLYDQTGKDFISESKQYLKDNTAEEVTGAAAVVPAADEGDTDDEDEELVIESVKDLSDTYMSLEEAHRTPSSQSAPAPFSLLNSCGYWTLNKYYYYYYYY